ncbi:MAG: TIGR04084 family radical SAM/SPASM domain-containing protein [Candidatus Ranarchaeia archaeon]
MLYFLVITGRCDLRCIYCGADLSPEDNDSISYSLQDLKNFISRDPDPTIIFYGGEPLLRLDRIKHIMSSVDATYLLQTNGLHLNKLEDHFLQRLNAILVSIDGRPVTTDYYRGNGVHQRILQNIRAIRKRGYKGDLIARMTVSEQTDIYLDVTYLLNLENPCFDHIHWQLDVLWDDSPHTRWNDFGSWRKKKYQPGISLLVRQWFQTIRDTGVIPGIVPFQGIMKILLTGDQTELQCGAGLNAFSINKKGEIKVCPVSTDYSFAKLGHIKHEYPKNLPGQVRIGEPCLSCKIKSICGGRCLFANKTCLWGPHYFNEVCKTVRHLIRELRQIQPAIQELIDKGQLTMAEFRYPDFNNGLEIIP